MPRVMSQFASSDGQKLSSFARRTAEGCCPTWVFPLFGFLRFVGDADFREAVAQSVTREAQQARGLALVAIGAAQGLLNHLIFPLLQSHALRKKSAGAICRFRGAHVQMDVGWVEHASAKRPRLAARRRTSSRHDFR